MTATSDTSAPVSKRGNRELGATFMYGGKNGSRQALSVTLIYNATTKQTWLVIRGPKHGTVENGKIIYDVSRQVLPE